MEEAFYRQIYPAVLCHLPDEKFAYLPGRETTLQLIRFTEYVTDNFNERAYTAAIFFDVSKAVDTAWRTGLIYKLHTAGLPDSSLLLASYYTNLKFRVKLEG
jgi:hypothetical protein